MEQRLALCQTTQLPHYNVEETTPLHYIFTTNGNSRYELSFIQFSELEDLPIYIFNIGRISKGKENTVDRLLICNTVAYVLALFFEDVDNAILSTCEVDDGMQMSRKRLFDHWYHQLAPEDILIKDAPIETGAGITWATMYYHKDNMFRSLLENSFKEYEEMMNLLFDF